MVCYDGLSEEGCTVLSLLKMRSKTITISYNNDKMRIIINKK